MTLHSRVAALEAGAGRQLLEIDVLNDLPGQGEPGGLRCRIDGRLVQAEPCEDPTAFRARCRRAAPAGATLVLYSVTE